MWDCAACGTTNIASGLAGGEKCPHCQTWRPGYEPPEPAEPAKPTPAADKPKDLPAWPDT